MESTGSVSHISVDTLVKTPMGLGIVLHVEHEICIVQMDVQTVEFNVSEVKPMTNRVKLLITRGENTVVTGPMEPNAAVAVATALRLSETWTRIRPEKYIYREKL